MTFFVRCWNLDIMRQDRNQISRREGTKSRTGTWSRAHACGIVDKGFCWWGARVEWILQIAFNVTLTAGEYVQFILMQTYRNITSALPTTNWLFKPIPPYYRLSNGARDYSSTIRNYNASYHRGNSTNSPVPRNFTASRNTKQLGRTGLSCWIIRFYPCATTYPLSSKVSFHLQILSRVAAINK